MRRAIPVEVLRDRLKYDPLTGEFTWSKARRSHLIGKVAGSKDSDGYVLIGIDGKSFKAHRLAWLYMTGVMPDHEVDHRNEVKDDNRWLNLRKASPSENRCNRGKTRANKTGFKGVVFSHTKNKFRAQIAHKGRRIYLGTFQTPAAAHEAYCKASRDLHGSFSKTQ